MKSLVSLKSLVKKAEFLPPARFEYKFDTVHVHRNFTCARRIVSQWLRNKYDNRSIENGPCDTITYSYQMAETVVIEH